MGTLGMEDGDADRWKDRTRGIHGVSEAALELYVQELDGRIKEMSAQLAKGRLASFREKVRKAVRDGKHRLMTGWVGEGAPPDLGGPHGGGPAPGAANAGGGSLCHGMGSPLATPPRKGVLLPEEEERKALDALLTGMTRDNTDPLPPH